MATTVKLLFASVGVAWAVSQKVSVPVWVLGKTGKSCKDTCASASAFMAGGKCDKAGSTSQWPQNQADFEAILDNIKDTDDKAHCSSFVDLDVANKPPFEGPSISKGVCWYYSKATNFAKCSQAGGASERRVCRCTEKKNNNIIDRVPIPDPIPYPATYKRAEKASISFTIKFPFFTKDAFECLGAFSGKQVTGGAKKHPEAFFKMNYGIRQSLGSEAVGIHFVAPKKYSDPLEAKVDVYAAPEDMSGAELFLAQSKIRDIGPYLVTKYPELKMCAYPATPETYETKLGKPPVFPASLEPTGSWRPASKDEISNDSMALAFGVDVRSLGVASAGALLVAGVAVLWRHRQERELVSTVCE